MKEKIGDIVEGTVVRVYPKYAILLLEDGRTGLLHISELTDSFVRNFTSYVSVGNIYKAKIIGLDEEKGTMKLSVKAVSQNERKQSLLKKPVEADNIDFTALEKKLGEWIEEYRKGE